MENLSNCVDLQKSECYNTTSSISDFLSCRETCASEVDSELLLCIEFKTNVHVEQIKFSKELVPRQISVFLPKANNITFDILENIKPEIKTKKKYIVCPPQKFKNLRYLTIFLSRKGDDSEIPIKLNELKILGNSITTTDISQMDVVKQELIQNLPIITFFKICNSFFFIKECSSTTKINLFFSEFYFEKKELKSKQNKLKIFYKTCVQTL